ncbi:MAG TPA: hypothetical protein VFA59_05880 [Vicinamibacterales bacterium]|nr:hypothetical protein [Vicinamibacterales bacterium]
MPFAVFVFFAIFVALAIFVVRSMNRRDFLLLRADKGSTVLSCESLFMRFIDAQNDGTVDQLFSNLGRDLEQVTSVSLVERSWLSRDDLRVRVDEVLAAFRRRGGRVLER